MDTFSVKIQSFISRINFGGMIRQIKIDVNDANDSLKIACGKCRSLRDVRRYKQPLRFDFWLQNESGHLITAKFE